MKSIIFYQISNLVKFDADYTIRCRILEFFFKFSMVPRGGLYLTCPPHPPKFYLKVHMPFFTEIAKRFRGVGMQVSVDQVKGG